MDPESVLFLIPLLPAAILGLPPLFILGNSRARLAKELAMLPAPDRDAAGANPTPAELAYLCGGEQRAAETALMGLYLDGRIRLHEGGPELVLTGGGKDDDPDPVDPIRSSLLTVFRSNRPIHAANLLNVGRSGRGMTQIRAGLAERGLMADSDELRQALLQRSGMRNLSVFCGTIGFLAVVIGALAIGTEEVYDSLHGGVVAGGLTLSLLGFVTTLTALLTGGWRLSTLSPAGAELAKASRAEYANTPTTLTRDEALRRTAVHGMRQLKVTRGQARYETPVPEDGEENRVEPDTFHDFAEQCVGVSGFDGPARESDGGT